MIITGWMIILLIQQKDVDYNYYESFVLSDLGKVQASYKLPGIADEICVVTNEDAYEADLFTATYAGLFNETDKEVYYIKNGFEKLYPASLTKCMTALLALEHYQDLDTKVLVTAESQEGLTEDASLANLKVGATYSARDLIYALLVPSGNDAANALAIDIAGSIEAFVKLMNQKAKELGMTRTHFVNPHGLQDKNHYTCVYDLYLLVRSCMKHPMFYSAAGSGEISVHGELDGNSFTQTYLSTNSYLRGYTTPPGDLTVKGSKTGYTENAKRCLILITQDSKKKQYISILCQAKNYDTLYAEMNGLLQIIGQANE